MSDGKLAQACDAFEASNRVEPRAGTLIRLGECRERNQQLASAWSAYKDALTRVKDPRKREVATAKAAALESRLSYLTVSVSDESRVSDLTLTRNDKPLDPMLWNRGLPVDGGDYVIVGRAPGQEEWQTTVHVPNEGAKVSVEVPKFKELGKVAAMSPATPPRHPEVGSATDHDAVPPRGLFTTRRKIALGVLGAAAIVGVTGAVFGESAKGQQSEAYRRCPEPATPCTQADQAESLIKSGQRRALVDHPSGEASGVAVADVTGDGKADLLVPHLSASTVGVLTGNGDGTFKAKVDYPAGMNPISVVVADVSGDSKPDLVVGHFGGNTVSTLMGNGDGTFQAYVDYAAGSFPVAVAVADANGDGKPDLVTANFIDSTASVLVGNGNGSFLPKVDYPVAANPFSVGVVDVNGDGRPDLVVPSNLADGVSVLLGNGDATFPVPVGDPTGAEPVSVVVADLTGDGKLDAVTANQSANTVSVLLGDGNRTYQAKVDYPTGYNRAVWRLRM